MTDKFNLLKFNIKTDANLDPGTVLFLDAQGKIVGEIHNVKGAKMPSKVDQLIKLTSQSEFWIHGDEDERVAYIDAQDGKLETSTRSLSKDQAIAFAKWILGLYQGKDASESEVQEQTVTITKARLLKAFGQASYLNAHPDRIYEALEKELFK